VVTLVSRSSKSIHNAASDEGLSESAAIFAMASSVAPPRELFVIVSDWFFPDKKSERTQKNVTVY
jgi:hypothetical protein